MADLLTPAVEPSRAILPWPMVRSLLLMLEQEEEPNFFPGKQPVTICSAHMWLQSYPS